MSFKEYPSQKQSLRSVNRMMFGKHGLFTISLKMANIVINNVTKTNAFKYVPPKRQRFINYTSPSLFQTDKLDLKLEFNYEKLSNDDSVILYQLVEAYFRLKRYRNCIFILNKLIQNGYSNSKIYNKLISVYEKQKDYLNAKKIILKELMTICVADGISEDEVECKVLKLIDDMGKNVGIESIKKVINNPNYYLPIINLIGKYHIAEIYLRSQ